MPYGRLILEATKEKTLSTVNSVMTAHRPGAFRIMNKSVKACKVGLCIVSQYIGCIDTLAIRYISYRSFQINDTSYDTFLFKFRVFWLLKFPNSYKFVDK